MTISWNDNCKIVFSDVDDTIAKGYTDASKDMISALEDLLRDGIILYLISGASIESIQDRIINFIDPLLRKRILVAHCSGAEVFGYNDEGARHEKPYYSLYDEKLSPSEKVTFREIIQQLLAEFKLKTYPTMGSKTAFREMTNLDPYAIMYADRGPQITFQLTNAYDLSAEQARVMQVPLTHGQYDLRYKIMERAQFLFSRSDIPVHAQTGGTTALDFVIKGVSKESAIHWFFANAALLQRLGLDAEDLRAHPEHMEIWGDKFSTIRGGTDRHICAGLPPEVRAIDFRQENKEELPEGYTIQLWNGKKELYEGLLEYLQSRKK